MTTDSLRRRLLQAHPEDAARVLEQYSPAAIAGYLATFEPAIVAPAFGHLGPVMATTCLAEMDDDQGAAILKQLGLERSALYLRRLKPLRRTQILARLPKVHAGMLRFVLRYPDGTVGQFMDPDPLTVNQQTRIEHVMDLLRDDSHQLQNEIYLVDEQQRLAGFVNVRDLIAASGEQPVIKLKRGVRYSIPARSRLGQVRSLVGRRYRDFYPVIDQNRRLVGVLSYEILLEVLGDVNPVSTEHSDLTTGMLVMADLFWNSFLNLLIPGDPPAQRREHDDQRD